ncbi:MAG: TIGR03960 family B12-binding radical SAM protein [Lachnospiraceae bacterium]|nr:TIGR03960 family B12-binding radical SAM protein [Lachnospiraceae bacterium]
MRKLALSDEILLKLDKPARYIGNEVNSVLKNKNEVKIRVAMCFPDVYEIGMSHLGIQILYGMLNSYDDVWCERVYSPWVDLDKVLRQEKIPLFALESQEPIRDFDFLGFTLQYEMCYPNILQVLDLSGITYKASERKEDEPLVIGGGPCVYNPEPIADFFDLFYLGEGEKRYRDLLDCYLANKESGGTRIDFLIKAAQIPGIYVPRFYQTEYHPDGTIKSMLPTLLNIPEQVKKEIVTDFKAAYYPLKPIVPFIKITQDRVVLEIQRGCIRGCRFCQAGQVYRPVRERELNDLKHYAMEMLKNTGHEEISLSSLSSSDYSHLGKLIDFLSDELKEQKINISLPSLRIDASSLRIMEKVQDLRKSSLTFAPEAGSQRLRDVINKGLDEEAILEGSRLAFMGGHNKVKLYFMLGLPSETDEDILAIGELANKIAAEYYETVPKSNRNGRVQINVSTSFFIPKAFTPFQWAAQAGRDEFLDKAYLTRKGISAQLNQKSIKYSWHEADTSILECVMARGDRRLSASILAAYENGALFDAWSDFYNHDTWLSAFAETDIDIDFYTTRKREDDEIFPWDFIDCGISKEYLLREWKKAQAEEVSPHCRTACQGCGMNQFITNL